MSVVTISVLLVLQFTNAAIHSATGRRDSVRLDPANREPVIQNPVNRARIPRDPVSRDHVHRDAVNRDTVNRYNVSRDSVHRDPVNRDPVNSNPVNRDAVNRDPVLLAPVNRKPVSRDTVNSHVNRDSVHRDPLNRDPLNRDPIHRDPVNRDTVNRDPVNRYPVIRDPVVLDPVIRDPVIREPMIRDPVIREPVNRDQLHRETPAPKPPSEASVKFLESVVLQQMSLTQTLQRQLDEEKERAAAVEDGLQNKIRTLRGNLSEVETKWAHLRRQANASVAFTVRLTADSFEHGVRIGHHATVIFDDVVCNVGDGYDNQTGIFTAPVAGTYCFFLNLMGHRGGDFAVVKGGVILDLVHTKDLADQGSTLVTSHLQAGDKVWVRHDDAGNIRGGWFTVFTGYLLHSD